ncbi:MAG: hypothetical protein ACRDLF_10515 [Solirubrobacteraceae bacterium]
MKLLTLLVVVAVGGGGAPGRRDREHHRPVPRPIFNQASITLFRVEGGKPRQIATAGGGKLREHVRPGRYLIKAVANDAHGQGVNPPCGSSRDRQSFKPGVGLPIQIKPGVRRVHVTLECVMK